MSATVQRAAVDLVLVLLFPPGKNQIWPALSLITAMTAVSRCRRLQGHPNAVLKTLKEHFIPQECNIPKENSPPSDTSKIVKVCDKSEIKIKGQKFLKVYCPSQGVSAFLLPIYKVPHNCNNNAYGYMSRNNDKVFKHKSHNFYNALKTGILFLPYFLPPYFLPPPSLPPSLPPSFLSSFPFAGAQEQT